MNSSKEYFGTDFVGKIDEIFERAEREDRFVFIHGACSLDDAISIVLNGLECDYPELYDPLKNIEATIEDRSFETKTGKCIKISLPPDELDFFEEDLKCEEKD